MKKNHQTIRKEKNIEKIRSLAFTHTTKQIGEILKLSTDYIRTLCRNNNIKPIRTQLKPINDVEHQVIIGSILGDGSISKYGKWKNSRLTIKHSKKQEEYVKYKFNLLKRICPSEPKYSIRKENRPQFKTKESHEIIISTMNNPSMNIYRDTWYNKGGIKYLNKKEFNNITPLSLAIWFMDDGTLENKSGGLSIATMCFTLEDVNYMKDVLNSKFNIKCTVRKNKILYIRSKSSKDFINLIKPYLINSMLYKISPK